jgi:hypothetical protein
VITGKARTVGDWNGLIDLLLDMTPEGNLEKDRWQDSRSDESPPQEAPEGGDSQIANFGDLNLHWKDDYSS